MVLKLDEAETSAAGSRPALTADSLRRVNPHHLWSGLTKDQQKTIGALAVARTLAELHLVPGQPDGWESADFAAGDALVDAVTGALGVEAVQAMPLVDLSAFGVQACRVCGCTDACGCEEGCWWVAPGLCSSCAPQAVEAAASLRPEMLAFIERGKGTAPDDDPILLSCLDAGLVEIYSGASGRSAWAVSGLGKLLAIAATSARGEVEADE